MWDLGPQRPRPGKIFHVCVTMFWCCRHPAGPAQPSHSPFSPESSVRSNIFFINSQYFWVWVVGVWLLWVNLLVPPTPSLSVGFSCSITAAHTFPAAVDRAGSTTATTVECWGCCCPNTMTQLPIYLHLQKTVWTCQKSFWALYLESAAAPPASIG